MTAHFSRLTPKQQKIVHEMLLTWGALTRLELGESMGNLPTNILHHLSKLGVKVSGTQQGVQWPREIEQVDSLINELHKLKPKWANAIKWRYTEPGDIRQQAKAHRLAKSTYYERFQHGIEWLGQRLSIFFTK
jgi:hypothetical protein